MSLDAKILVTGANNVVAKTIIAKLLEEGKKVRATANKKTSLKPNKNLELQICSLFDVGDLDKSMQGIEMVYHCDEFVSFLPKDEQKIYNVNVIGTENLVNVALDNKVEKLIFMSSSFAFGTYQHKKDISEKTTRTEHKENTYYTICKSRAELEIFRASAEGLKTIITCPSIILQNEHDNSNYSFINIAKSNYRFYPVGKNGFVGLDDLVSITIQLMESDIENEKFIISSENRTYQSVLELINPKLKNKKLFNRVNNTKAKLIGKINSFRNYVFGAKPFLTSEILNFDGKEFIFENNKIKSALNFKFTPIDKVLEELK